MGRVFTTGQYTYRIHEGTLEARYDKVKGEFFKCFTTEAWTGIARLVLQEHNGYDVHVVEHCVDSESREETDKLRVSVQVLQNQLPVELNRINVRLKDLEEKTRDGIQSVDSWARGELNVQKVKREALEHGDVYDLKQRIAKLEKWRDAILCAPHD